MGCDIDYPKTTKDQTLAVFSGRDARKIKTYESETVRSCTWLNIATRE